MALTGVFTHARKWLIGACLIVVALWSRGPVFEHGALANPIDLLAFRCGGMIAVTSSDPYRAEPLRACERAAAFESGVRMVPGLVVPAPLPPYALLAFSPLGLVSFRAACVLWFALLVVAFVLTCAFLARLTAFSVLVVACALLVADLFASAIIGQLVPLVVLAVVAAAWFARQGRWSAAAACALATMIEPHLGLPLCIALGWYAPRARAALAAGGIVLACATLSLGPAQAIEYFTQVLPAQGRTEGLEFGAQYGLSAALVATGIPAGAALVLGAASYVAMAIFGIWAGVRASRATGDVAYIALAPPAFVLFGGVYVHVHQMAIALPLALLMLARVADRRMKAALVFATICLAIPWQSLAEYPPVRNAVFPRIATRPLPNKEHLLDGFGDGRRLAQDAWGAWTLARPNDPRTATEDLETKLPTWIGLAIVLALATRVGVRGRRLHLVAVQPRDPDVHAEIAEHDGRETQYGHPRRA